MNYSAPGRIALILLTVWAASSLPAQDHPRPNEQLKFVVVLTRHGVRSPTGNPDQYYAYSRAPWPQWDVPPGYLTPHGFEDMRLFGAYDRLLFAREGLLQATGCEDASRVTFYTDSDQRTRETGRALAEGMFPDCSPAVGSLPQGTPDPLFHAPHAGPAAAAAGAHAAPTASVMQSIRPQLAELDQILATCGPPPAPRHTRVSIFDSPPGSAPSADGHPGETREPLNVAATMTENFLLEYTQGMPERDVGWGCVDGSRLRRLIGLHTAAFQLRHRSPAIAGTQSANLLDRIRAAMAQAAALQTAPPDAHGTAALFLVGHDTNLANVAGALGLHWVADGRRDDTPPGSALVFELWRDRSTGTDSVRLFYTAQTLEQMRHATVLTAKNAPVRIPLHVSACGAAASGCSWTLFEQLLARVSHPNDALAPPLQLPHGDE